MPQHSPRLTRVASQPVLGWTERQAMHWNAIWGAGLGVQQQLRWQPVAAEERVGRVPSCMLSSFLLQYMAVLYRACARYNRWLACGGFSGEGTVSSCIATGAGSGSSAALVRHSCSHYRSH